ncbi:TrkA-N domain protein [Pyrolobus fumarii 1A]|uniref:TrkA-N domain protein n=1 Tax=Pyrolobus fumarii (strain DSM 11204 / 1A) TaxID=694429 RepID=G0EDB6_PYRF1|nr:TrkA family potassium uptake protein [Pyrolobus fumarii]AEM39794.1 TrkA-N domain protein [Pyrolobus fumarii 1A]
MRILVIGAGQVGSHLARILALHDNDVIVVDKDPAKCQNLRESIEADIHVVQGDATDPSLYEEIDLSSIDVVVAATDRDEVNLFVATLARDYGVKRIIARVRSPLVAKLMEKIGVEYVITEPLVTAKLMASIIEGKYTAINLVPVFTGNYVLVSLSISETDTSVGKSLDELDLPRESRILAVFDGENMLDPMEVERLHPNYVVIALVRRDVVQEFIQAFR